MPRNIEWTTTYYDPSLLRAWREALLAPDPAPSPPPRHRDAQGRFAPRPFQIGEVVRVSDRPYCHSPGDFVEDYAHGALGRIIAEPSSTPGAVARLEFPGDGHQSINVQCLSRTNEEFPQPVLCGNPHCQRAITLRNSATTDGGGQAACDRCIRECDDCGVRSAHQPYSEPYFNTTYNGRRLCEDCSAYCDECGRYYSAEGQCEGYHPIDLGIRGYGHTSPSMWLGGPLPRDINDSHDGYYIGFELEISAEGDQSAHPIYDWAEKHLGHREALIAKEDSSVEGFEIVSQPMTPAFFESVNWESLMDLLNENHPLGYGEEPYEHGLHVHIGRIGFKKDDVAIAAYSYLLAQDGGSHLERVGRRAAYHYCERTQYPVSSAIMQMGDRKTTSQVLRASRKGAYPARGAINLQNSSTIEIRSFKSTRSADELRDAVRLTYLAADYIRYLRVNKEAVSPKSLHWSAFTRWVGTTMPEAFPSIAGHPMKGTSNARTTSIHDKFTELVGANYDM